MPATTDAAAPDRWLSARAPGWLQPSMVGLAVVEAAAIIPQAGLIALACQAVFVEGAELPVPWLVLLLLVLLLRATVVGARTWLAADASRVVRNRLRRSAMEARRKAGPASMPPTGALVTALDEQVEALDGYYARFLPQRSAAAIVPLAVASAVLVTDVVAGAFLVLTAPLIPVFMVLIGHGAQARAETQFLALGRLGGWFLDRLRGAATLRRLGARGATLLQVRTRTDQLRRATMEVLRLAFLSSAVLEFFAAVAIAAIAIYVGMGLLGYLTFGPADDLTLASGLFVLLLAPEFYQPLRALSQGWHDRADAQAAVLRLRPLLATPAQRPSASGSVPRRVVASVPQASAVRVRCLRFAHGDRRPLFDRYDLEIEAGERVLLVGPSGGGKSTLIQLFAGFLRPDAGRVEIDGLDPAALTEADRAARIAWLGQRPMLFSGSLRNNIQMGWPEASSAQVEAIAETSGVQAFARRLPDGLDTAVGEGGHRLSGGQAQRVALARALLRPRPLILLDEPTAFLDPVAERFVLDAMDRLLDSRPATVVCASHRPGLLDRVDRVIRVGGHARSEGEPSCAP